MGQWGGARVNAGRPARGPIASSPHRQRPSVSPRLPLLVVAHTLPRLRGRAAWAALHRAFLRTLERPDFRIVAFTRRARRVYLVVEADHALALARGMQGFQVAAARALNRVLSRSGTVFADRYRPLPLRTRPAVRAALAGFDRRLAYPTTALLCLELVPRTPLARPADPDP